MTMFVIQAPACSFLVEWTNVGISWHRCSAVSYFASVSVPTPIEPKKPVFWFSLQFSFFGASRSKSVRYQTHQLGGTGFSFAQVGPNGRKIIIRSEQCWPRWRVDERTGFELLTFNVIFWLDLQIPGFYLKA